MKKIYITPEFDYVSIFFEAAVCFSAETPVDDIQEDDDSYDP